MISFIVNPLAGDREGLRLLEPLQRFLDQRHIESEVLKTIAPGDGTHLASVALKRGADHVVAVGGDGTVNEVLASIYDQDATLGIIPIGKVNSIARGLNLPAKWEEAAAVALAGKPRSVDVGTADDRPFLGAVVIGLEGMEEELGTPPRGLGRLMGGKSDDVRTLALEAVVDGRLELRVQARKVVIGNVAGRTGESRGPWTPDDRRLDVFITDAEGTSRLLAGSFELRAPPDLAMHLDGELRRANSPLMVRLADAQQKVLVSG